MSELGRGNEEDSQLSQPKWRGAPSIQMAQQLNELLLGLVCNLAFDSSPVVPWPLVGLHRELWCRLDAPARKRLASFPFVIVDIRFNDPAWWRALGETSLEVSPRCTSAMPSTHLEWFALETMMLAWQVSRGNRGISKMLFAMDKSVADCIATWTMQQVRDVSVECSKHMRMRWENEHVLWRDLLISAANADESSLKTCQRDAKILFCGEIVAARAR